MSSATGLYHSVINDVVNSVRDAFLDEAVDENVLQELKTLWTTKLEASKTIEPVNQGPSASNPPAGSDSLEAKLALSRNSGSGGGGRSLTGGPGTSGGGGPDNQLVITDPNRLVPVQITIPAQPGNPNSVQRAITVQVPAHALQQNGPTSALLQEVLTRAITQALTLSESHSAIFLQTQINQAFKINI